MHLTRHDWEGLENIENSQTTCSPFEFSNGVLSFQPPRAARESLMNEGPLQELKPMSSDLQSLPTEHTRPKHKRRWETSSTALRAETSIYRMRVKWALMLKEEQEQEKAVEAAIGFLTILEKQIEGKKSFGGKQIGFLHLITGWLALWLDILEEVGRTKLLDPKMLPSLHKWTRRLTKIPLIREPLPSQGDVTRPCCWRC